MIPAKFEGILMPQRMRFGRVAIGIVVFTSSLLAAPLSREASAASSVTLDGAGSTWSSIAVDQWRADVARFGLNINFTANGSTTGRNFFVAKQIDFAVSEIPFQAAYRDASGTVVTNEIANVQRSGRTYTYLPIVAGGTSFMYHLDLGGRRVTNLQLTPDTIAKIFTGAIHFWDDPAIKATNPTLTQLTHLAIRPIVRSDGSGTTAQFTAFMAAQTPAVWDAFCRGVGLQTPCPATSLYPTFPGSVGQLGSTGVSTSVAANYNNGAITYVEYGYAKKLFFPVASVQNRANQFTQPTAYNVSTALKGATLNADNTQNLGGVYTYADPAAYPVSSYSYMIAPTSTADPFSVAKGDVLRKFIAYFVCAGQNKAESLGYSPMPFNLRQAAFDSASKIPGTAPLPQLGSAACPVGSPPPPPAVTPTTTRVSTRPTTPGQTTPVTAGNGGSPNGPGNPGTTKANGTGPTPPTVIDPNTGKPAIRDAVTGKLVAVPQDDGVAFRSIAASDPVAPPDTDGPVSPLVVVLAVLGLLGLVFIPPLLNTALSRRKAATP